MNNLRTMAATRYVLLLFMCALSGAGCIGFGDKVAPPKFNRVKTGMDSQKDVERLLGKPKEVFHSDGRTLYIYNHAQLRPYASGYGTVGMRMTVCSILFETNGLVVKKLLSRGDQSYQSGTLGLSAKTLRAVPLNPADIVRGETTYRQIEQSFGEPLYSLLTLDGGTCRTWQSAATEKLVKVRFREFTVWFNEAEIVTDSAVHEWVE